MLRNLNSDKGFKPLVHTLKLCKVSYSVLFALLLLAACAPPPTATPAPTPLAANANWTPVVQTFDGIEMVLVPQGCFTMGHDSGRRDERPQHQVCFTASFWIGRTEVTNAQYGAAGHFTGDNRPRENLTWFEARDFCAQRGERLPTEAEWEYAGRGPDSLLYPWGNELIDENLVFDRNSNNETAAVGSRPNGVSWVGALDMAGNVHEWTNTIATFRYPYDASDGRETPDDLTSPRVYRSSLNSYVDFGASLPARFRADPNLRDWFLGFRCARAA
jgi:formylglycine-generating enzyme required for sulfatase activity